MERVNKTSKAVKATKARGIKGLVGTGSTEGMGPTERAEQISARSEIVSIIRPKSIRVADLIIKIHKFWDWNLKIWVVGFSGDLDKAWKRLAWIYYGSEMYRSLAKYFDPRPLLVPRSEFERSWVKFIDPVTGEVPASALPQIQRFLEGGGDPGFLVTEKQLFKVRVYGCR